MDALNWLRTLLWQAKEIFPIEVALTLGLAFFALSWVVPRRLVSLPSRERRASALTWLGICGSLALLAVATGTSWLGYRAGVVDASGFDGWWRRPAPLLAAALVVALGAAVLSREPRPAPGERALAPRRHWWAFTPRAPLWTAIGAAGVLALTAGWHTLIGVSAPAGANRFGIVPEATDLPVYFTVLGGSGYAAGAGWPNHLVTLLAIGAAAAALCTALAADANRPASARVSAADTRAERTATARMMVLLVLGGLLLTLGAVCAFIGFAGDRSIGIDLIMAPADPDALPVFGGSDYQAFAPLMHRGGYVIQGLGAALLLRLAVDTVRAAVRWNRAAAEQPAVSVAP
ncbi:hypothetical protein [Leucobacter luti]|uniref:Uncharacterized protein n=1 Tax=Leucobacter luti TaxID=340320 RepID=A0A4Q7U0B1_9MICO|nr:hypothetical protein [Leucobacter luti]MBL3698573.1 hypothetical protein [Leucobacter luti]RZT65948.1 hypothetical protein EV139_1372 [Leucobacter luti]